MASLLVSRPPGRHIPKCRSHDRRLRSVATMRLSRWWMPAGIVLVAGLALAAGAVQRGDDNGRPAARSARVVSGSVLQPVTGARAFTRVDGSAGSLAWAIGDDAVRVLHRV